MADKTIGELPVAGALYEDSLLVVEQQSEARSIQGALVAKFARESAAAYVQRAVDAADKAEKAAAGAAAEVSQRLAGYVDDTEAARDAAKKSEDAAAESARDAADVALHPPILKEENDHWWIWSTEADDYVDSGVDAGVSLEVVEEVIVGEPGSGASVKNLGTKTDPRLRFTIPKGDKGDQGDVWVPSVSKEGELTWEKNGEAAPQPVNIKGPQGEPSTVPGPKGDPGVSPKVSVSKEGGVTTVTITDAEGEHTAEIKDGEVTKEALDAALAEKQDTLTFDEKPIEGSANPVKSGGVWTELEKKANKADTDPVVKWHSNRNLLDNWYFVGGGSQQGGGQFPINQRGLTEYSGGGYTIDRWTTLTDTGASVKIAENGEGIIITAPPGDSYCNLFQIIDFFNRGYNKDEACTVTFSVLYKGTVCPTAYRFNPDNSGGFRTSEDWDVCSFTYLVLANESRQYHFSPDISVKSGFSATIKAAKLEFGSQQTLAHQENGVWVLNEIPDYATELAKCQRYQEDTGFFLLPLNTKNNFDMTIKWAVEKRSTPTATVYSQNNIAGKASVWVSTTDSSSWVDADMMIETKSDLNGPRVWLRNPVDNGTMITFKIFGDANL